MNRFKAYIGDESWRVKRHKKDGTVSNTPEKNRFISVGSIKNVHLKALHAVYGTKFCEASLCSLKQGPRRMLVCDCDGRKSHDLPAATGPKDKKTWQEVERLSKTAMEK